MRSFSCVPFSQRASSSFWSACGEGGSSLGDELVGFWLGIIWHRLTRSLTLRGLLLVSLSRGGLLLLLGRLAGRAGVA